MSFESRSVYADHDSPKNRIYDVDGIGVILSGSSCNEHEQMVHRFGPVKMGFLLSGSLIDGATDKILPSGNSLISTKEPESSTTCKLSPGAKMISLYLDPSFLKQFPGDYDRIFLQGDRNEKSDENHCHSSSITPSMQVVLNQLENTSMDGPIREIYLKGKIYELIALYLEQFIQKPPEKKSVLRPGDTERIRNARELLLKKMDSPPSLLELSRLVGLNDFKLKKGFQELYRTSVFGFLREQRMEKARQLLEEGKMSVTEVVFEVGYNDPSHFASEFKKRYGVYPGTLLASSRKV